MLHVAQPVPLSSQLKCKDLVTEPPDRLRTTLQRRGGRALLRYEVGTEDLARSRFALSPAFELGRVFSRDQVVVLVRSLIQIIAPRRWRPAR